MKPIEILQGKWLGHPLHPAIVHIPVGAWIVAAVFDLVSRNAGEEAVLPHVTFYCVIAGLATALLAVPTGVADWSSIKKEKPAWKLGLVHMALNLLAAIVWAANLGLRWETLDTTDPVTPAILITSVAGAVLVIAGGYIGSLMVFDHGVSVARMSKQKWRTLAQRGGSHVPDSK